MVGTGIVYACREVSQRSVADLRIDSRTRSKVNRGACRTFRYISVALEEVSHADPQAEGLVKQYLRLPSATGNTGRADATSLG